MPVYKVIESKIVRGIFTNSMKQCISGTQNVVRPICISQVLLFKKKHVRWRKESLRLSQSLTRNTISRLQPCNAGIIKNFKHKYIKLLIHYILARIDIRNSYASKTFKDVIILKVIKWIQTSWTEVSENTIKNCFEKCRFDKPDVAADETVDH